MSPQPEAGRENKERSQATIPRHVVGLGKELWGLPQVGSIFSPFLCHCEGSSLSLVAGESINPSRRCTPNSRSVLTTHTEWQLDEVKLTGPLVQERMPKLSKRALPGPWEKQAAVLGFPGPVCSFNVQHCLPVLVSLIWSRRLPRHKDVWTANVGQWGVVFTEGEWASFCCCCLFMEANESVLNTNG